jgi:hypothetical protein
MSNKTVSLVLGSGGARSLAHIGTTCSCICNFRRQFTKPRMESDWPHCQLDIEGLDGQRVTLDRIALAGFGYCFSFPDAGDILKQNRGV